MTVEIYDCFFLYFPPNPGQAINGVEKIRDGYNPATWMLEVSSQVQETALGVNFAEYYKSSELYR